MKFSVGDIVVCVEGVRPHSVSRSSKDAIYRVVGAESAIYADNINFIDLSSGAKGCNSRRFKKLTNPLAKFFIHE